MTTKRDTAARLVVTGLFVLGLGAVAYLNAATGSGAGAVPLDFHLSEVSERAGVDFRHRAPHLDPRLDHIAPYIASMGASVSVADPNGDGWPDLYFTSSGPGTSNGLYLNRGDGTFREVAREAGVAALNSRKDGASMGSVWADYDSDGDEDLLVYRWGYPALLENAGVPDGSGSGVPRFREVTRRAGLDVWMNANCAVWLDYDRDGRLDLYLCGYYREDVRLGDVADTRIMPESWEFAANGGVNRLFRNEGDGRFREVTRAMGVGSTRWTLAASSADFDEDGWPDLYLANDYGPEELFLNREGRRFTLASAGLGESGSGMSVALGDLRNRGRLDVYVTNISERGYIFQGNNLRLNLMDELGRFEEIASGQVADAGWAWGAQFGDLDLDGRTDLFVANGMISADRDRRYWYDMAKITGANRAVFEDAANWPAIEGRSLSGYQRSRLLLNRGDRGLVDVAELAGVTDRLDGRGVAMADIDNDGDLDVLVANQSGPALIYRNATRGGHHWIGFDLVGTASNRSAVGASVTVHFGGERQRQSVAAATGFAAQNDHRLLFGLGRREQVDRVEIRWPSGRDQVIREPEVDRYHRIREPASGGVREPEAGSGAGGAGRAEPGTGRAGPTGGGAGRR